MSLLHPSHAVNLSSSQLPSLCLSPSYFLWTFLTFLSHTHTPQHTPLPCLWTPWPRPWWGCCSSWRRLWPDRTAASGPDWSSLLPPSRRRLQGKTTWISMFSNVCTFMNIRTDKCSHSSVILAHLESRVNWFLRINIWKPELLLWALSVSTDTVYNPALSHMRMTFQRFHE